MRGLLLRLDQREHILLLNIHHSATDGWSMRPLVEELATLYEAALESRPSTLAELPIQYADYAVWQREWLTSGPLAEQLDYWKKQLADAPARIEIQTDLCVRQHKVIAEQPRPSPFPPACWMDCKCWARVKARLCT